MHYLDILMLFFSVYGLSWAITESDLTEEFRGFLEKNNEKNILRKKVYTLFSCIYCMSFWSGILLWLFHNNEAKEAIIFGLASIASTHIFERILHIEGDS